MDIFCICRICLNEPNTNFVSIYSHILPNQSDFNDLIITSNNNQTQISSILDTLTGDKYVCIYQNFTGIHSKYF